MKNWTGFERIGISLENPVIHKLWRISRILGNKSMFDDYILEHNIAQIDCMLELYIKDYPDELQVTDNSIKHGEHRNQVFLEWSNILRGSAKAEFDKGPASYLKRRYGWK